MIYVHFELMFWVFGIFPQIQSSSENFLTFQFYTNWEILFGTFDILVLWVIFYPLSCWGQLKFVNFVLLSCKRRTFWFCFLGYYETFKGETSIGLFWDVHFELIIRVFKFFFQSSLQAKPFQLSSLMQTGKHFLLPLRFWFCD